MWKNILGKTYFFSYETSLVAVIAALLKWNLKADAKSGKKWTPLWARCGGGSFSFITVCSKKCENSWKNLWNHTKLENGKNIILILASNFRQDYTFFRFLEHYGIWWPCLFFSFSVARSVGSQPQLFLGTF